LYGNLFYSVLVCGDLSNTGISSDIVAYFKVWRHLQSVGLLQIYWWVRQWSHEHWSRFDAVSATAGV